MFEDLYGFGWPGYEVNSGRIGIVLIHRITNETKQFHEFS